jgi:hypothetical protein
MGVRLEMRDLNARAHACRVKRGCSRLEGVAWCKVGGGGGGGDSRLEVVKVGGGGVGWVKALGLEEVVLDGLRP